MSIGFITQEGGGPFRPVHQHQRLNRLAAVADALLVDDPVVVVQAQYFAEFTHHFVVNRQAHGAVLVADRWGFHQRADVQKRRGDQRFVEPPAGAHVVGLQHHQAARRPATETHRHHEQPHAAVLVQHRHGVAQLAHVPAPLQADLLAGDNPLFLAPGTLLRVENRRVDGHVRAAFTFAGEPERTQAAVRQRHHGRRVHQRRLTVGGETHLPLTVQPVVAGHVIRLEFRLGNPFLVFRQHRHETHQQ